MTEKEKILASNEPRTTGFLYIKDSADKDFPNKKLSKEWIPFIKDAGTSIDLSDALVKKLTQQLSLLQQIIVLLQKVKKLLNK